MGFDVGGGRGDVLTAILAAHPPVHGHRILARCVEAAARPGSPPTNEPAKGQ